jgi:pimeloyl-ACP methyl ester carboxylesterase
MTRRHRIVLQFLGMFLIAVSLILPVSAAGVVNVAAQSDRTSVGSTNDANLQSLIANAIVPDTGRGAIRLPSVSIDETGDLSVVVALREIDDLNAFRAAAEQDVFDIFRAVYDRPDSPVRTATVIGTYPVAGTGNPRELRVLRVVLSNTHAADLNWTLATPTDLFTIAETYRLYPPIGDAAGNPIAPNYVKLLGSPGDTPIVSSPINVGDRNIFLRCIGSGQTTVILEAGYGDDGTIWAPVQIQAAEFVRICSYDRAGLSRSDEPDHYPRTGAEVVADLHTALMNADVKPPYLLVGHSYGALFSRLFAATYPDEVVGMLFLDPWPEDYDAKLRSLVTGQQWTEYESRLASDPDNEVIDFPATYDEIRAAGPLPDVPLLILSHGQAPTAACCPSGWPIAEQEQLWQELEKNMANLTAQGQERTVPDSGHMIHQARPELVVAAIEELVDQLH